MRKLAAQAVLVEARLAYTRFPPRMREIQTQVCALETSGVHRQFQEQRGPGGGPRSEHWSPEVTYTDPMAEVCGHEGIAAVIDAVQAQFPGYLFTQVGEIDAHQRQVRFRWGLDPQGAEPLVIGFDVLVLEESGRIQDVRGHGKSPPRSAVPTPPDS
ncbi:nuclear transport factor 2 family protein [Streptomyces sp. NPDC091217]|uniref:nuclear transport factor 2 family protein n=1 Tax=Streptomyces sp. NPDC091217 TaxID=3365975 RepID=UPI00381CA760